MGCNCGGSTRRTTQGRAAPAATANAGQQVFEAGVSGQLPGLTWNGPKRAEPAPQPRPRSR